MNHPFPSLRHNIGLAEAKLSLAQDAITLLKMSPESLVYVRNYRGALLPAKEEAEAYKRTAARLGVVMADLELDDFSQTWSNFLSGQPLGPDGEALLGALHAQVTSVQTSLDRDRAYEHDTGSSSYSDFTDDDGEEPTSDDDESDRETSESSGRGPSS